ncbi:basic secretory protein-like protein [Flavitalea flava]
MKKKWIALIIAGFALSPPERSYALQNARSQGTFSTRDSVTRGKYTLVFINNEAGFDTLTRQRMIEAFFEVYPQEAKRFNKNTLRRITFIIDPTYNGVAETGNGVARYNPGWLKSHPEDIDVVTHEVMHIVQDYRDQEPGCPGWLTEGIADYVRYVYGVNNLKGNWKLPDFKPSQSYTNAYRVTARFLLWVEKYRNKHIVDRLDKAARSGTYTSALWIKLTGETVDQLWSDYSKNPALELVYR